MDVSPITYFPISEGTEGPSPAVPSERGFLDLQGNGTLPREEGTAERLAPAHCFNRAKKLLSFVEKPINTSEELSIFLERCS